MPTGYTDTIKDGITFEQFALNCARAFGALITMRDEPSDAPIPDEISPSTSFHAKGLKEANERSVFLCLLTKEQVEKYAEQDYQKRLADWTKYEREKLELKNKYEEMLAKVMQWEVPTEDHRGLKDFMLSQLRTSIEWDCIESDAPEKLTPDLWLQKEIERALWNLKYHRKEMREEIKRAKDRTEWIKALKQSLSVEPNPERSATSKV